MHVRTSLYFTLWTVENLSPSLVGIHCPFSLHIFKMILVINSRSISRFLLLNSWHQPSFDCPCERNWWPLYDICKFRKDMAVPKLVLVTLVLTMLTLGTAQRPEEVCYVIMLYDVMSCRVVSCRVVSCRVVSWFHLIFRILLKHRRRKTSNLFICVWVVFQTSLP
jgi:hypothetical protein